jgi:hypothetical protein
LLSTYIAVQHFLSGFAGGIINAQKPQPPEKQKKKIKNNNTFTPFLSPRF